MEEGKSEKEVPHFTRCTADDFPIFSYTSGTTGDSKGAKMSHRNFLSSSAAVIPHLGRNLTHEDSAISYLPYPHIFE
jgi:long-chain acyl-CoA synthetase